MFSKILINNFRFYLITCGYNVYNPRNIVQFLVTYFYPSACKSSADKPAVNSIKHNTLASLK